MIGVKVKGWCMKVMWWCVKVKGCCKKVMERYLLGILVG